MHSKTLKKYLTEISDLPNTDPDSPANKEEARLDLIKSNLKLVVYIAKQYKASAHDIEDLISEGNCGLMLAAERFDFEKGVKFSTFASFYIKSKIREFIYKKNRAIAIPLGAVNKYFKIKKAEEELKEELGRDPTTVELSNKVGVAQTQIVNLKNTMHDSRSLEQELSTADDNGVTLADLIPDEEQDFITDIENGELTSSLLECVNDLNEREKEIIKSRFGLFGSPVKTLDEIGLTFNLTKERVRQIQESCLSKLKLGMERGASVKNKNTNLLESETAQRKELKAKKTKYKCPTKRIKRTQKQEEYWETLKGERFNIKSI